MEQVRGFARLADPREARTVAARGPGPGALNEKRQQHFMATYYSYTPISSIQLSRMPSGENAFFHDRRNEDQ